MVRRPAPSWRRWPIARPLRWLPGAWLPPRELAPDETAAVVARSAGLPLLIEDLLAALLARPAMIVAAAVPERFSESCCSRLDALGSTGEFGVRAAAVFGPRFDWRLLGPVTALAEPGIGAAIREAIDAQLLVTDNQTGRPVFRHALTAEVIAADLDPSDRAALQLRAADAVARAPAAATLVNCSRLRPGCALRPETARTLPPC